MTRQDTRVRWTMEEREFETVTIHNGEIDICTVLAIGEYEEVGHANARLIAAAPEMLAALRKANEVMDLAKQYFPKSIRNADRFTLLNVQANSVQKAIDKATGETG